MADGSNIANILRAIGAYREPDNAPASPRLGGDFLTPAWQAFENGGLPRQMPRQMRSPELRAQDPDPHVSAPALAELQRRMAAAQDTDAHSAYAPPEPVTWKEAGEKLLEFTGLPSVRRAAFHVGNSLINNENEWGDAAWEAGNAALMLAPAFEATRAMTAPAAAEARLGVMPPEAPPTPPPHYVGPNGMPIAPAQPFRNSLRYGSEDLADAAAMRSEPSPAPSVGAASAGQFDTSRTVYRGLGRPYDPADGGYYQAFTNSAADAREYGPHVMAANLRQGRNLAIDGGGNNFNSISASQLPAEVRARLHPGAGGAVTTDQIAHAAREAGYDSVTVRNVYDTRWGERPPAGVSPQTVDFVFDTKNISPVEGYRYTPPAEAAPSGRVHLSDSDRALLAELERDMGTTPNAPEAGQAAAEQSGRLSENQIEEAIDRRHGRGVSRGAERTVPTANFMPTLDQLIPDPYAAELESDAILRTFNAHAREELRTGRLAQEVEIPIADLVAVQSRVRTNYADSLEHARGDLPEVLYRNGRYYLVEGHNRVAAMAARGDTQVRVRAFGRNEGRTRAAPDAGAAMGGRVPSATELNRVVADARRANPNANIEDVGAIRWVRDSAGNYHIGHAMEVDHQALLERLQRSGIEAPPQTREMREMRGHFYRDENGQWRSITMEGGESVPLSQLRPTRDAPDGGAASVERTETPRRLGEDMGAPTTRPPWPEGIFTFAGENAVGANTQALSEARRMAAQGADRNEIWQRTGWFQGADGKWRFEIDDSGSRVSLPPEPPGMIELANQYARDNFGVRSIIDMRVNDPRRLEAIKYGQANTPTIEQLRSHRFQLGEVLHHAPLYEAYPEFQGLPVGREMGPGNHGSFAPTSRTMRLRNETPILGEKHDVRSTGLHETQHVIQDHEGFSPGSDPARFRGRYKEHLEQTEIAPLDRQIHDLMQQDSTAAELYRARNRGQAQLTGRGWTDADIDRQEQLESALRANPIGEQLADLDWRRSVSQRLISQVDDAADSAWAVEQYRRSSGETEARNVQTRRDFTPEERRSRPPWETQDIPDDQQIIGDVSASKPRLPKSSDVSASTYEEIARKSGIPTRTPKLGDDVDALAPLILSPALIAALQAYANPNGQQQ